MNKELSANHTFSRYRIVSKIGAGGMGEVYLAEDARLRRRVAIKVLSQEFAASAVSLLRFEREALAASALNHPNILTIYEFGDENGVHFLAAEFIDGKTLQELIRAGRIRLADALEITIQIASALDAAHVSGIVHRDIKPGNVMLRRADNIVKVLDFGLAKMAERPFGQNRNPNLADERTLLQTQAGALLGTAAYMSPEQARGEEIDARSDLFSLGVVLYELLTAHLPFTGKTVGHLLVSILDEEPPPVSAIAAAGSRIPAELERITRRALEKDKQHRYQTAAELVNDLKALRKQLEFERELSLSFAPSPKISDAAATRTLTSETVATAGFAAYSRMNGSEGGTVAVLPFVNMSRDQENDYFSDGLAEELINVLSKIRGLRVAARTSAFSFKGKQATIAEIGRALNVASVVEGSVRNAGNRVRISVQLVKVTDGYHLWTETYDRLMEDIFAVQDDIAHSVVEELRAMLLGKKLSDKASQEICTELTAAVRGRADNAEAQRLMLLGRHFLDRTTREDTATAIDYFRQALNLDAEYALCWAELGRAHSIQAGRGWSPVASGFAASREATTRALALEPNLAEGHAQCGRIQIAHDWDFRGAQTSYRKAINLAPGSSSVLDGAAMLAYKLGRFDEALEASRSVLVQDPLSAAFWHNLGLVCHAANRLDESAAAFRRALELIPQRFVTRSLLALVLLDNGQAGDALAEAMLEPDNFWQSWSLAIIRHHAGQAAESRQMIENLLAEAADSAYQIAEVYAMRGEPDTAFDWLEKAFQDRDAGMTHTKVNPRFRPLHNDSRWPPFLQKIGFD